MTSKAAYAIAVDLLLAEEAHSHSGFTFADLHVSACRCRQASDGYCNFTKLNKINAHASAYCHVVKPCLKSGKYIFR
jgi:hypothetical protein